MWWLWLIAILLILGFYPLRTRCSADYTDELQVELFILPLPFCKKAWRVFSLQKYQAKQENPEYQAKQAQKAAQQAAKEQKSQAKAAAKAQKKAAKTTQTASQKVYTTSTGEQKTAPQQEPTQPNPEQEISPAPSDPQAAPPQKKKLDLKKIDFQQIKQLWQLARGSIEKSLSALRVEELRLHIAYGGDIMLAALTGGLVHSVLGFIFGVVSTKARRFPAPPDIQVNWQSPQAGGSLVVQVSTNLYLLTTIVVYIVSNFLINRKRWQHGKLEGN